MLTVTDISPNFPGGRVISVVVDPTNPNRVYAASDIAGVWASTDSAKTWHQSSEGLLNPVTAGVLAGGDGRVSSLAIDDSNPQRLLYAAIDDDGRPTDSSGAHPGGGLYASVDGASSWQHVALPCSAPGIVAVTFSAGTGFVSTNCGVYYASSNLSTGWQPTTAPAPFRGQGGALAVSGQTIYGCGQTVYRSTNLGQTWGAYAVLPSLRNFGPPGCSDLAVVPDDPANKVLAVDGNRDTWLVDFSTATPTTPSVTATWLGRLPNAVDYGSGTESIYTVKRPNAPGAGPGTSYDIFAGDGHQFHQYLAGSPGHWSDPIGGMHVDTWGMGIYLDPQSGSCIVYAATDGGLSVNHQTGQCGITNDSDWTSAGTGLHVYNTFDIAGLTECTDPSNPCPPALYVSAPDNGTWWTTNGGTTWTSMGCCGDSGAVNVDPGLRSQMVTTRGGYRELYRSSGPPPGPGDDQGSFGEDVPNGSASGMPEGTNPPATADFFQVNTLPGETPASNGDYLGVDSTSGGDEVIRTQNPGPFVHGLDHCSSAAACGWSPVSSQTFPRFSVQQVQAAGGHTSTTIYVLASGTIYSGQATGGAQVATWANVSSGLSTPANFFADPYDANILYASDVGTGQIMATTTGGVGSGSTPGWTPAADLTRIATHDGEFQARSFSSGGNSANLEPLSGMYFVRGHPELRIAALGRGGLAFSRDGGADWISLVGATGPIDLPVATYYDIPSSGNPSLYVAFQGRGVQRVDAPFPTLEGVDVSLNGLYPGNAASLVDDTTGVTTSLHFDTSDGTYRGTELIDSARTMSFSYHYLIDGIASGEFTHSVSSAESANGVVYLAPSARVTYTGDTSGDYHDQVTLSANATLDSTPLSGAPISFVLGNQSCQATTGTSGSASCPLTINQPSGSVDAVVANFTNPATGAIAVSGSAPFTITREQDTVAYTGPTVILQGGSGVTLKGLLLEDGNTSTPISGRMLTLSLGSQSCTATTDATGTAGCAITFSGALGPQPLAVSFAGDAYYLPSSDTGKTAIVFSFPSRGAFTLGDNTAGSAASSTTVTWWADTWNQLNSLSGGPPPPAFKGFAATVSLPTSTPPSACAGNWTSTTGNSPPPTSGVPSYMGVLVTSQVNQTGSTISGNTVHIVVVKTNPGYAPDPSNHGTGTIIATYC